MSVEIVTPTAADLAYMDENMRDIDRLEFDLMTGGEAILTCFHKLNLRSSKMLVGKVDGVPVVLYGVTPVSLLSKTGQPWMVATDRVRDKGVRREFIRLSRLALADLADGYDYLWNLVHHRNRDAIRWLKWLGFNFTGHAYEVRGHRFEHFKMELDDVLSSTHSRNR